MWKRVSRWASDHNWPWIVSVGLLAPAFFAATICAIGFVSWWWWNNVIVWLFPGAVTVSFWQALAVIVLVRVAVGEIKIEFGHKAKRS